MSDQLPRLIGQSGAVAPNAPVALVTGAAGAIGNAIVKRLSRAGTTVVAVDRDAGPLGSLLADTNAAGLAIEADLSIATSASDIISIVGQRLGRLDHVVNNAGLNKFETIFTIQPEDWDAVLSVNLRAPMLLCQAAIPFWKAQGGGSIVTIGSRVWQSGSIPAYSASKAGVVGLTRSFAVELGGLGVRANAVAPSYIDTAFTRQTRSPEQIENLHRRVMDITPLQRIGTTDDIANAVAFLISDEASFITGEILHVCGGAQLAPQLYPFQRDHVRTTGDNTTSGDVAR